MSAEITLKIDDRIRDGLKGLKPDVMLGAIQRGMTIGAQIIAGKVIEERLTGKGPFPVAEHRLGVVTGRLRSSVRATPARIVGQSVIVSIGTPVEYARAHEFGFEGDVTVRAHDRQGHKVREHQRHVKIAERAPIRTGIKQHINELQHSIAQEVLKDMGRN